MLAETGLVAMNQSLVNDVPEAVQYSDAQQSAVVTSAFTNLTAAGGFGYQLFKTSCNSGMTSTLAQPTLSVDPAHTECFSSCGPSLSMIPLCDDLLHSMYAMKRCMLVL
jgi:hypothetical protein